MEPNEEQRALMTLYEQNRAKFSPAELQKYANQWVAFSPDGSRVVACADTLEALEARLAAAGDDPQNVSFERIEFEDSFLGSAELG